MHEARTTLSLPMRDALCIELSLDAQCTADSLLAHTESGFRRTTRHMCSSRLDLHPRRRRAVLGVRCTRTSRLWLSDRSSEEVSDDRAQPASTLCMGALQIKAAAAQDELSDFLTYELILTF